MKPRKWNQPFGAEELERNESNDIQSQNGRKIPICNVLPWRAGLVYLGLFFKKTFKADQWTEGNWCKYSFSKSKMFNAIYFHLLNGWTYTLMNWHLLFPSLWLQWQGRFLLTMPLVSIGRSLWQVPAHSQSSWGSFSSRVIKMSCSSYKQNTVIYLQSEKQSWSGMKILQERPMQGHEGKQTLKGCSKSDNKTTAFSSPMYHSSSFIGVINIITQVPS